MLNEHYYPAGTIANTQASVRIHTHSGMHNRALAHYVCVYIFEVGG